MDSEAVAQRLGKAIATFDAKVQLRAEGWDLTSIRHLTWVVDVSSTGEGDDRTETYAARYLDTRESTGGRPEPSVAQVGDGAGPSFSPPPMPLRREQYWTRVTLRDGHTLTLSVSVSPLELRGADQALFRNMVDMVTQFLAAGAG